VGGGDHFSSSSYAAKGEIGTRKSQRPILIKVPESHM